MSVTQQLQNLRVGPLTTSKKGGKSVGLIEPLKWVTSEMNVAFEPSVFNNEPADRLNLTLQVNNELWAELREVDLRIVELAAQHSERIWGRTHSREELQSKYISAIRENDKGYPTTVRFKINKGGVSRCNIWNEERKERAWPDTWKGSGVRVCILVKKIWLMGSTWGVTLEAQEVQFCDKQIAACPFSNM